VPEKVNVPVVIPVVIASLSKKRLLSKPGVSFLACPPCIQWHSLLAGHLWSCRALLTGSWGLLTPSWTLLGTLGGLFEPLRPPLGGVLGPLERLLGRLGSDPKRHQDDMPKKVNFMTEGGSHHGNFWPPKRAPKWTKIGPKTSPKLKRFLRPKKIVFKTLLKPS